MSDSINNQFPPDLFNRLEKFNKGLLECGDSFAKLASDAKKANDQITNSLTKTEQEQEEYNAAVKEAERLQKQKMQTDAKLAATTQGYTKELVKAKLALQKETKATKDLVKWQKANKGSIDKLNAANVLLRKRVNAISSATEKGRKKIAAYNKVIDRNTAKIRQNSDALSRQKQNIGNYKSALSGVGTQLKSLATGFIGFTALLSGATRLVKDAIEVNRNFEKSFTNVLTLLSEAEKSKFGGLLEQGAADIMLDFGLAAEDVNKALFDAISAGIPAGEAIGFLRDNAELAIGGVTDLSTSVDGVTSVMNAFKISTEDTEKVTSAFFTAQKYGKTTVEELASNVGKVAPIAKQAGLGLNEMLAVMAELTKQGISTEESSTALKATMTALIKPSEQAKKAFDDLGIEYGATNLKQNGFLETFKQVVTAVEDGDTELANILPNVRALTGAGALQAAELADLDVILAQLNTDYGDGSSLAAAFGEQMETGAKQSELAGSAYRNLLLEVNMGSGIWGEVTEQLNKYTAAIKVAKLMFSSSYREEVKSNKEKENQIAIQNKVNKATKEQVDLSITYLEAKIKDKTITAEQVGVWESLLKRRNELLKIKKDELIASTKVNKESEKETETEKKKGKEKIKIKKEVAQTILKIEEDLDDDIIKFLDDDDGFFAQMEADDKRIEAAKKTAEAILEVEQETAEAKQALREQEKQAAIDLANELFNFTAILNDRKIAAIEAQVNNETLTEEEGAKKIAEIKKKQAIADKLQALFNIGMSTAEAIMKVTAQTGVGSAILVPLIAALGAAQAAAVIAAPIPEFELGGDHLGGPAKMSEKGRELFLSKGKAFLTPQKETVANMPAGTFIDHKKTLQIMNGNLMRSDKNDFKEVGKNIEKAINKKKTHVAILDNRPFIAISETSRRRNSWMKQFE